MMTKEDPRFLILGLENFYPPRTVNFLNRVDTSSKNHSSTATWVCPGAARSKPLQPSTPIFCCLSDTYHEGGPLMPVRSLKSQAMCA